MSLHDQIMNIPEGNDDGLLRGEDRYWIGFVNGKHQAAQIAKEADELMAEMAEALSLYVKAGHGMSTDFQQQGEARQSALYALERYKESTK